LQEDELDASPVLANPTDVDVEEFVDGAEWSETSSVNINKNSRKTSSHLTCLLNY